MGPATRRRSGDAGYGRFLTRSHVFENVYSEIATYLDSAMSAGWRRQEAGSALRRGGALLLVSPVIRLCQFTPVWY